ncbi:4-alpha-glucanotransferase [Thermus altitudinis]|uniref:4-alpha-glucanotransferase n=1 Tax=Thermus altitudinis TaxID=2908145 RepID=UPI001FA96F9A|nr:4-alpha-glucanotransferase [Thermus altitudinis]
MELPRAYGLLLHPTSLPGPYGIGVLGEEARGFLRFLQDFGGRYWQVLPLGPTGYGDSPYQAFSAFAGNPYLIDLRPLAEAGYMALKDPGFPQGRVDYGGLYAWKWPVLRAAFQGFQERAPQGEREAFQEFWEKEAFWLRDYALFMALKEAHGGLPWNRWPMPLRLREDKALKEAEGQLSQAVAFHAWTQWLFFQQWGALREEAEALGLAFIGDMPIFVAEDSAEVWAHPEWFHLDEEGRPTVVAGVPPDYFSETGQRWGNPLYRWEVLEKEGFSFWMARLRKALELFHLVRIDHFRGFEAYWEIPASCPTAVEGRWVKAPGEKLFQKIQETFGQVPILAEDLGVITEEVVALRERFGLPGMKVLQFAFDGGRENPFLPHNYPPHGRVVVYTGTHDNDTTLGWYRTATPHEKAFLERYLAEWGIGFHGEEEVPWALMHLGMKSVAQLAVYPVQDVLALGSEARMNYPGRPFGNWAWRLRPGELRPEHGERLLWMAKATDRV